MQINGVFMAKSVEGDSELSGVREAVLLYQIITPAGILTTQREQIFIEDKKIFIED